MMELETAKKLKAYYKQRPKTGIRDVVDCTLLDTPILGDAPTKMYSDSLQSHI